VADFLFDSSGDWIAFRRTTDDRFHFNEDSDAMGGSSWNI
jgi:hypothetical protein